MVIKAKPKLNLKCVENRTLLQQAIVTLMRKHQIMSMPMFYLEAKMLADKDSLQKDIKLLIEDNVLRLMKDKDTVARIMIND